MRKVVIAVALAAVLGAVNFAIASRERLLESGRIVRLELAPVDPRSLMQGDYMALRFHIADEAWGRSSTLATGDGRLVVDLDARDVARFRRFDGGESLAPNEARLRYRVRDGRPRIATNAWFFEEGHASDYAKARYGEFRVAPDGEALLARMLDAQLQPLGAATR